MNRVLAAMTLPRPHDHPLDAVNLPRPVVSRVGVTRDFVITFWFLAALSTPVLAWMVWGAADFKGFAYFWSVVIVILTIPLFGWEMELASGDSSTPYGRCSTHFLFVALRRLEGRVWPVVATCSLTALIRTLFFFFRLKRRFFYGLTESAAGIAIAGHRITQESAAGVPVDTTFYIAILTAGVYLVVRGFDNMHQAWITKCDPLLDRLAARQVQSADQTK